MSDLQSLFFFEQTHYLAVINERVYAMVDSPWTRVLRRPKLQCCVL